MNRWSHIFLGCLCLTSVASSMEACTNKTCDSLLLFGDSYFDTGAGNAVSMQFGVPLVSPTPPYFNGRHSNGPIWIDYTSAALCLPVTNYAVAGAETGIFNVNTLSVPPFINPIGGLFQQLERFAATGKKIRKNQIVVVDGAGNDFLALVPNNLNLAAVEAAGTQAITNLATVVLPGLQKLGAEKIVLWNLGDLSMLPLFNSPVFDGLDSPLVRELMQGASVGFNTALVPVVQELNTDLAHLIEGVNDQQQIFIFDAFTAFNELAAELVAEGKDLSQFSIIANYGGPYIPNPLIPPGTDPNSLPFYDQVHPTTASWALFSVITSAYLDTLINAPRFVAAAVDLALETASAHRDLVDNHFRTLHEERYIYNNCCCCDCCMCDRFQLYGDLEGKWGSTSTRCGNFGLNYNTQLGMLGLDFRANQNINLGASFTYQRSHARIKEHRGSMDLNDYIPTLYTTYFGPCYFLDLSTSLHCYQFRKIRRNVPFIDRVAKAHTHGFAPELNFEAGYVGRFNCLTVIPLVGLSFENLVISHFLERGAKSLNMRANRQYQRSLIGKIGGQLFYRLWNDCTLAFGEVFYLHECLRNKHRMGLRFANSVDNAVDYNFTSPVKREAIKYSLGLSTKYGNWLGNISYLGETNFKEYGNAVRAELNYAF
jgi:outer membrane lipase/esterase